MSAAACQLNRRHRRPRRFLTNTTRFVVGFSGDAATRVRVLIVGYLRRMANSEQPVQMLFMGSSLLKPRGRGYLGWTWNMPVSLDGFDPVAAVVDWLDACRARNLDALLDLYADDATLECKCEGKILKGPRCSCRQHSVSMKYHWRIVTWRWIIEATKESRCG
jgi:hypothetical protein